MRGAISLKRWGLAALAAGAMWACVPAFGADEGGYKVKALFSFEGRDAGTMAVEDWPAEFKGKSKATVVDEHAAGGKKALRLESYSQSGNVRFTVAAAEQDWAGYDALVMDLFNPDDTPMKISGFLKASESDNYNQRCNWERTIRPGATTFRMPLGGMVNGARKPFNATRIAVFDVAVDNRVLYIANVRLVKGVEGTEVKGIRKFDFGPANGAVMPGFTGVTSKKGYDKAAGYGWLPGGSFFRDFDISEVLNRHRPCDDLCRDFCSPVKATFAVDLPDGDWRAWVMLAPPGGHVWSRAFKHRTVSSQGAVVLDEPYDVETFKAYEFLLEDTEDLPGDSLWERYVKPAYKPCLFDAKVTDGQLKIEFDGHGSGWATQVCGIVVWPKSEEAQAAKWLVELDKMRKEQFDAQHVETMPPAPAAGANVADADKAKGYVLFVHSPDRDVNVNSVATPEEAAAKVIDLAASRGECQDGCFGIAPLRDLVVNATAGPLAGPGGRTIPQANVELLVSRYKALNHDAIYTVEPKYLDAVPAGGVAAPKGIARSFWLVVHVPADAAPGKYTGQVKLSFADGKTDAVDVALTVWPIQLSDPEIPIGMYMMHPPYSCLELDEKGDETWKAWKEVLLDARAHGMTSVDPVINMPLKGIANGKAAVDFAEMDRFMDLAKTCGFTKELSGYAVKTGFTMQPSALDDDGKLGGAAAYGLGSYGELVRAYFDAYREHAKEKNYLPICFCGDDEYLVHPGKGPERLTEYYRVLKENAPGIRFAPVDSIMPDEKPDMIPTWEKMLANIDTWGAGLHSPKMAELVKKAGGRLWLYNAGRNRFTFGSYMFFANKKYDVKGFFQWIYLGGGTLGNYDLASFRESNYGVVYPSSRGLRTTIPWERIRAGTNDHRYLQTAWELIAAAKASGKKAEEAKALEGVIEKTFSEMTFGKAQVKAPADADNPRSPARMESFRRTLAERILKLQPAQ